MKKKTHAFTDADFVVQAQPEPKLDAYISSLESAPVTETNAEPVGTSGIVIEKVPVPKRGGRKPNITFPIDKLTAGTEDSFLVPAKPEDVKKVTARIRTFAYKHDFRVILRSEATGVRVWRKK
jgi:hypothetical protein